MIGIIEMRIYGSISWAGRKLIDSESMDGYKVPVEEADEKQILLR